MSLRIETIPGLLALCLVLATAGACRSEAAGADGQLQNNDPAWTPKAVEKNTAPAEAPGQPPAPAPTQAPTPAPASVEGGESAETTEPSAAAPVPVTPRLRRGVHDLAALLPRAHSEPPLEALSGRVCTGSSHWVKNPLSAASPRLKRFHRLVTGTVDKGIVEQWDSVVLPVNVSLSYELELPPDAQLELELSGLSCGPAREFDLLVDVQPTGGAAKTVWRRTFQAKRPGTKRRWEPVRVDLSAWAEQPVTLTLEVRPTGQTARRAEAVDTRHPLLGDMDHRGSALLGAPAVTGRPTELPSRDRNVLLIIVDAMRGDVLKPTRSFEWKLPTFDGLTDRGVTFAQAFSVGNQTRASTLALLTGQPPSLGRFHFAWWTLKDWQKEPYYESQPPLVTRTLRREGWRVMHFGHNHFLFEEYEIGLDHGYDQIVDDRRKTADTAGLAARSIDWLEKNRDRRFFLTLNFVAPHTPYEAPQKYHDRIRERFGEGRPGGIHPNYLAEVAYADYEAGRVLDALESLGLTENTLVILTADHGEVMDTKHGCYSERFEMNCHLSHGMTLYDEELRVPFVFAGAGVEEAGGVVPTAVSHVDFTPTLLSTLGVDRDPRHTGQDLTPAFVGRELEERPVYAEGRVAVAVRENGLKFILHNHLDDTWTPARTGGRAKGEIYEQLFDLENDPAEHRNLALERDERLPALRKRVAEVRRLLAREVPVAAASRGERRAETASDPGAEPALGQTTVEKVVNHLRLNADGKPHQLRGSVSVEGGAVACLGSVSEGAGARARCAPRADGGVELSLDVAGAGAEVELLTWPAAAPLVFSLELDGAPLPKEKLWIGRFGVALADPAAPLSGSALTEAFSAAPPRHVSGKDLGLFFWRGAPFAVKSAGGSAAAAAGSVVDLPPAPDAKAVSPAGNEAMGEGMHGVLKDLGYTK